VVAAVTGDDPQARADAEVTALFDRYAERLLRHLLVMENGLVLADAEDLVQEAFLVTRRRWSGVRGYTHPAGFLFQTAFQLRNNQRRAQQRRPTEPLTERETWQPVPASDLAAAIDLWNALGQLSERQRQVVLLRHLSRFSVQETAQILGVAPGTVTSTTSDALQALRRLLNGARD
jgi:RNA polymerase sigma factor (sigma-70 family)